MGSLEEIPQAALHICDIKDALFEVKHMEYWVEATTHLDQTISSHMIIPHTFILLLWDLFVLLPYQTVLHLIDHLLQPASTYGLDTRGLFTG